MALRDAVMGRRKIAIALALLAAAFEGGHSLVSFAFAGPTAGEQRLHGPLLAQAQQQAPRRLALVIGNGDYEGGRLPNAVNDAEDVRRTLQSIGFQVSTVKNANQQAMEEAVDTFRRRLRRGDIALFYFSGHGLQVHGETFLVPLGFKPTVEAHVKSKALGLNHIMDSLEATEATARVVILDACRSTLPRSWPESNRSFTVRGLASPPEKRGTLIVYATAAGQTAADSLAGSRNSPFTTFLVRHLPTPNLDIRELMLRVRRDVMQATNNKQTPWEYGAMTDHLVLNPLTQQPAGTPVAVALEPSPAPIPARPGAAAGPGETSGPSVRPTPSPPNPGTVISSEQPSARSLIYALRGHTNSVNSVAFSPGGRRIVSSAGETLVSETNMIPDFTIRFWDATTGRPIAPLIMGHTLDVKSVVFSPDGKRIVSASGDKTLRIWDANTGKPIGSPLQGHTEVVGYVAYSPDGKRIVSVSRDKTLRVWDAATGKPIGAPLKGHTDWVSTVAYSPNSRWIVSGSWDNTLRLWDAATGKPIGSPLQGHTGSVYSVAFSPDGKRIVSGSEDKTLRLWDAATGKPIGLPAEGHTDRVLSVAFSPDGRRIVSGSYDNTLRLWDAATGRPIGAALRGHSKWVGSVDFSPDGRRIVSCSGDNTLRLWDAATGKPIGFPP